MTWYELWLFLHVGAVVVWVGGAVTGQIFSVLAKRSGDPARSAAFGRDMSWTGMHVLLPASIVTLVTGIALTEDGNWPWGEPFVWLGVVGWVVVAGIAFGYVSRTMSATAARMAAEGPSPELVATVSRMVLLARVLVVLLFVLVFLMTVKPGT